MGKRSMAQGLAVGLAWTALFAVCGAAMLGKLPLVVAGLYLGASAAAFLAYARDKAAAQAGAWRVREDTLHLLALAGGWPGALIAQRSLRHKSKKLSFQLVFWATVLLNCSVLIGLLTPAGGEALDAAGHALRALR